MSPHAVRKLHAFLGLVPLGAYLGFHAWELWPVRFGRGPALERLETTSYLPFEIALVLLPLALHAALGLRLARAPDPTAAYASSAFRRFQATTGGLSLAFLGWHGVGVWLPRAVSGRAADAYGAMLDQVGTLPGAALYVVGSSAVCVHFGQGLAAAWIRLLPSVSPRSARAVGVCLGLSLWFVLFAELATYATGGPFM